MALFQISVLKKYLKQQDTDTLGKAYKKYSKYFLNTTIQENIRNSKEEQFQATFLTELFVNILGYTLNPNPNFNLTTEFKNQKNARKADGAILKNEIAIGVIELKGTKTKDLESIRKQAFDYKANQKGCVYVVTSNFEKLRFYINDATEFEEFNLFELTEERFQLLYLCLQKDNVLTNIPLSIKEASIVEEEKITKQFYSDYSVFKRELFRDLVKQNGTRLKTEAREALKDIDTDDEVKRELERIEKNVKLSLFKKSQKLIDRFLFIFFAEDRGLLPPNSTIQILDKWKADVDFGDERPLFGLFKQYFKFLDTGRKGTTSRAEIYAYNGGLFKPDTILDNLVIDNELLYKHTLQLANYDFESQVDVNILGHIFENSLNEIESVNAEIEGGAFDKQKSKRKKDGVFYTPKYITKYIVENTVGKLCEDKKTELGFQEEEYFKGRANRPKKKITELVKLLDDYRAWLLQITICDPACGSGAFLNQALDFLIKEHNYIDELKAKILGGGIVFSDIENTILENNIYGVDLNEESVEIAKLSLWLRTAQPRRKLNDLSSNIKCGNSLIDDKKIAGDKAFHWETTFAKIFKNGGFDVVIGNPPYGTIQDKSTANYFKESFISFQGNLENYCFFTEKFIQLSKINGQIGLIIPVTWLTIPQFKNLRKYILNYQLNSLVELPTKVFSDADLDTLICTLNKKANFNNVKVIKVKQPTSSSFENSISKTNFIKQEVWLKNKEFTINLNYNPKIQKIINKMRQLSAPLKEKFRVSQGIVPYARTEFYKIMSKIEADKIVDERLWHSNSKLDQYFKPELKGEDVTRFQVLWNGVQWVKYGDWLARSREKEFFTNPRVLLREITRGNGFNAGFTDEELYNNPGIINIISKDLNNVKLLKSLVVIINSKLFFFYHIATSPKANLKTSIPKVLIGDVEGFPIISLKPELSEVFEKNHDEISNKILTLNKKNKKLTSFIIKEVGVKKLSRKLESWHDLDFGEFIKELNKAIKATNKVLLSEDKEAIPSLSKKDEFEWLELFEENKKKAQELQTQINQTEKEIDAMVYELYRLTEEEITIVENS